MERTRITTGFKRLAIVAGAAGAFLELLGWLRNMTKAGESASLALPLMWIVPILASVAIGFLVWAAVRIIGWAVAGFFAEEKRTPL